MTEDDWKALTSRDEWCPMSHPQTNEIARRYYAMTQAEQGVFSGAFWHYRRLVLLHNQSVQE